MYLYFINIGTYLNNMWKDHRYRQSLNVSMLRKLLSVLAIRITKAFGRAMNASHQG